MLKLFILVFAVGIQSSLAASVIGDDPTVVTATATACTTDDFSTNGFCIMSCTLQIPSAEAANYAFISDCWQYYDDASDPSNANVILFGATCAGEDAEYTSTLNLTTYNAGQYVCVFEMANNTVPTVIYSNSVTVEENPSPVELDGPCTSATECLALNTDCVVDAGSKTCQCLTNYTILLTDGAHTLACLEPEPINGTCNIDGECSQDIQDITCTANSCKCNGNITHVAETDLDMCLDPASLSGDCTYSEQCLLTAANSICSAGKCACSEAYLISPDKTSCEISLNLTVTASAPCATDNFTDGDFCVMNCSLEADPAQYMLGNWCWKYVIDSSDMSTNESVIVFDGVSNDTTDTGFNTYLNLTTFNAGTYLCYFEISAFDITNGLYGSEQITTDVTPVAMGGTCALSTDCLALNSICGDDLTCQCPATSSIQFNGASDTVACLAPGPIGSGCNVEEQCLQQDQDIHCDAFKCTCDGTSVTVADTGSPMCLDAVSYNETCVYNEQCTLAVTNAYCSDDTGRCACSNGYALSSDQKQCNIVDGDDGGLSGGAIAGIVIGSLAGCAIIGGVVFYIVKKKK